MLAFLQVVVALYGVDAVGRRERRPLEAWVFSSSGGLVWSVCSGVLSIVPRPFL